MMVVAGLGLGAFGAAHAQSAEEYLELWEARDFDALRPLIESGKKAGKTEAWYLDGRLAMLDYDFARATKSYTEYKRLAKKKPLADFFMETGGDDYADQLQEAKQQFDRFQDIAVIDAVKVNRTDFFKHLRLPLSAGRVVTGEEAGLSDGEYCGPVYIAESGNLMLCSRFEGMEDTAIGEVNILTDGSRSEFKAAEGLGDHPAYPFLSADGTTLYFSAEGPNSMGGTDIFIATRDPQTGEYRAPVNAGMPFNSAADDYMMAIDEENGVGWWATDARMLPDDEIMLYVYVLPEGRKNFNGTTEEKIERAQLTDYRQTWVDSAEEDSEDSDESDNPEESDNTSKAESPAEKAKRYEALAREIRQIQPGQKPRKQECRIPIGGGRYIYSADDVKTAEQKRLVQQYIVAQKEYEAAEKKLDGLRRAYAKKPGGQFANEIKQLEQSVPQQRKKCEFILSQLYKMLK